MTDVLASLNAALAHRERYPPDGRAFVVPQPVRSNEQTVVVLHYWFANRSADSADAFLAEELSERISSAYGAGRSSTAIRPSCWTTRSCPPRTATPTGWASPGTA